MIKVVGVRFKEVGKVYYFDPADIELKKDMSVIVETQRGLEFGICVMEPQDVPDEKVVMPLRRVVRIATKADDEQVLQNREKEKQAGVVCQQKITEHGLDMKFVDVEMTFDGGKILFYFTSDGRVDFRELVRDLASVFRTRIELRQIGVRDEAKMLGGLGICGKPLCCSTFLDEFQPVSIKMAKEQNLSLNPTKISGTCGRLMCCLKYEQDAYEHLHKITPRQDSVVQTPHGQGTVVEVGLLRGMLKVRLDNASETIPKWIHKDECTEVRTGTPRRTKDDNNAV